MLAILIKIMTLKTHLLLTASIVLFVLPVSAQTEEQCKTQALTAYSALNMIKKGIVSANKQQIDNLQRAINDIEKGQYCSAKDILYNATFHQGDSKVSQS